MAAIPLAPQMRVHKKTGHARCRVNGREYWFGRAGTTECAERYRAFLKRWAEANDAPAPPPPPARGQVTVAGALGPYLAEIKGTATAGQLRTNSRWWRARSMAAEVEHLAGVRLADFGPKIFAEWLERVAAKPITKAGEQVPRTRTHIRELATELLRVFEWAVREELIGPERLVALRTVKLKGSAGRAPDVRKPVADDAIEATLPYLPPAMAAVVTICRHSAARPGEVLAMRPCDIDRRGDVWLYRPARHKTQRYGRERVVVLGPRCMAAISPWLNGVPDDAPCFTQEALKRARVGGTIKTRRYRRSRPVTSDDLRRCVAAACRSAGVESWTPYQLRHAGLTEFRQIGGLDAAQVAAGHSSASVTERYAGADLSKAIEAARRVG